MYKFGCEKIECFSLKCIRLLKKLNIPISNSIDFSFSNKMTSVLGLCSFNKYNNKNTEYSIRISNKIIVDAQLENVLIHEMLHTIEHSHGHKGKWKHYANIVSSSTKYKIERTGEIEKPAEIEKYTLGPYDIIICPVCKREDLVVDNIKKYDYFCLECWKKMIIKSEFDYSMDVAKCDKIINDAIENKEKYDVLNTTTYFKLIDYASSDTIDSLMLYLVYNYPEKLSTKEHYDSLMRRVSGSVTKNHKKKLAYLYLEDKIPGLLDKTEKEMFVFSSMLALTYEFKLVDEYCRKRMKIRESNKEII